MTVANRINKVKDLLEKVARYNTLVIENSLEASTIADMQGNAKDLCDQAKAELDQAKTEIDQWS